MPGLQNTARSGCCCTCRLNVGNKVKILILSCMFFLIHSALIAQIGNPVSHALEEQIKNYYEYEKKKDWDNTYLYRTPLFRKSVPLKTYKGIMSKDSNGWELLDIQIKSIVMEDHLATVKIDFTEKFPKEGFFLPKFLKAKTIAVAEVTLWEQINGKWYVRNPGGRNHLSLNVDLVY